jgi:aspartate carbamoyltransferase catalytic subunit
LTSLVSIKQLNEPTIEWLLRRAQYFVDNEPQTYVRGTAVNLFFEPSTRTALSFQIAAQRLGLKMLDFTIENSSTCKGESLIDTLQTVNALGVQLAVVRHGDDWPTLIAEENLRLALVNAGSGHYEHPTQVLLELMGAQVSFSGPEIFYPYDIADCRWVDFDQAVAESDVVMMLRVQHERHQERFDVSDYNGRFGLNSFRLKQMKKDAIILHPGPVNRSVEVTGEVLQDSRCKILQQVANGVAVRMAVLEWCFQEERCEQLVSA